MKKIPTLFERDWNGDRSRVTREVHKGCEWVAAGDGWATRKIDGTCCRILDGKLWKRRELRKGESEPNGFELADHDDETGKIVGWVPVGDGPEDRYHREAMSRVQLADGTYELVGPKIQGNPERFAYNTLVPHGCLGLEGDEVPRDFDGLSAYLSARDYEGIVWHHSDGRMVKIKARDFGIKRKRA